MIEPLGARLLVATMKRTDLTSGGLHRPDSADDRPVLGRVLAVGNSDAIEAQLGVELVADDVVMFGRFAGIRCDTDDDDERILLLAEELIARVPREPGWSVVVVVPGTDTPDPQTSTDPQTYVGGAPAIRYPLGDLRDTRLILERGIFGGVLEQPVAAESRAAIQSAGLVTVVARRGREELKIWRADATRMFGSGGRFNAIGEDDSAGEFGGSPEAPLAILFEADDQA